MTKKPSFDELSREIGSLIMSFGSLEAEVVNCLSLVCNESDHEVGRILGDQLQLKGSIVAFRMITTHVLSEKVEALRTLEVLCRELEQLAELRNAVVHAEWCILVMTDPREFLLDPHAEHLQKFQRTPVRRKKKHPKELSEPSEIRALNARCQKASSDLVTFEKDFLC